MGYSGSRRGAARARVTSQVMSAVETKLPGHFTAHLEEYVSEEEFATDTIWMEAEQLSYTLGKGGATRRKLAAASGAVVEYVGNFAHVCGTKAERSRAGDYIHWLCDQADGNGKDVLDVDVSQRDDATEIGIPQSRKDSWKRSGGC